MSAHAEPSVPPCAAPGSATGESPAWTEAVTHEARPPLVIGTGASAQSATRMRRGLAEWLAIDVGGELLHDLTLAAYEAVANVAEHAYAGIPGGISGGAGPVRLCAFRSRDAVLITVADEGRWRAATGEPHRSRGLPLIRQLVEQVHIDRTPTGTVLYLRTAVAAARPEGGC